MQHIRSGNEHVWRVGSELFAVVGRRVPIVDRDTQAGIHLRHEGVEFVELVLLQGFEGENIERMCIAVLQQGGEHRNVVDHGFATRRGRGNRHMATAENVFNALGLMGIQSRNASGL